MNTENFPFFTDAELQLLFDAEIFIIKRTATEKLFVLFSELIDAAKDTSIHKKFSFPPGTDCITGKISKGENYNGSPYVILDFPKLFDKENIFAFRSMFWFGNYFSNAFMLGGDALRNSGRLFLKNYEILFNHQIYFSLHTNPWHHHIETSKPVEEITTEIIMEHIANNHFIKLTSVNRFHQKEKIIETALKNYELMLGSVL